MKIIWSKGYDNADLDKDSLCRYYNRNIDYKNLLERFEKHGSYVQATEEEFVEYMKTLGWSFDNEEGVEEWE